MYGKKEERKKTNCVEGGRGGVERCEKEISPMV